jgi:putative flippase GtrA
MITRAFGLKLGRFGIVGLISTAIYVVVATIGTRWTPLPLVLVSTAAYLASGVWSYVGHYHITFRSDTVHGTSVPKFFVLFGLGYAVQTGIVILNRRVGLPPELGTVAVAILLPVMNFIIMQLWVFAGHRVVPGGTRLPIGTDHPP